MCGKVYREGYRSEVSPTAAEAGYPRAFPHKLVAFRKELVDAFVE